MAAPPVQAPVFGQSAAHFFRAAAQSRHAIAVAMKQQSAAQGGANVAPNGAGNTDDRPPGTLSEAQVLALIAERPTLDLELASREPPTLSADEMRRIGALLRGRWGGGDGAPPTAAADMPVAEAAVADGLAGRLAALATGTHDSGAPEAEGGGGGPSSSAVALFGALGAFRLAGRAAMEIASAGPAAIEEFRRGSLAGTRVLVPRGAASGVVCGPGGAPPTAPASAVKFAPTPAPSSHRGRLLSREVASSVATLLAGHPLLDDLPRVALEDLCRGADLVRVPSGAAPVLLAREGGGARHFFFLLRGCVTLHRAFTGGGGALEAQRRRSALEARAVGFRQAAEADRRASGLGVGGDASSAEADYPEIPWPGRGSLVQLEAAHGPCTLSLSYPWGWNEWAVLRGYGCSHTAAAHPGAVVLRLSGGCLWRALHHARVFHVPLAREAVRLAASGPPGRRRRADDALLADLLRRHPAFRRVDPARMDALASKLSLRRLRPNEVMCVQNAPIGELAMVLTGSGSRRALPGPGRDDAASGAEGHVEPGATSDPGERARLNLRALAKRETVPLDSWMDPDREGGAGAAALALAGAGALEDNVDGHSRAGRAFFRAPSLRVSRRPSDSGNAPSPGTAPHRRARVPGWRPPEGPDRHHRDRSPDDGHLPRPKPRIMGPRESYAQKAFEGGGYDAVAADIDGSDRPRSLMASLSLKVGRAGPGRDVRRRDRGGAPSMFEPLSGVVDYAREDCSSGEGSPTALDAQGVDAPLAVAASMEAFSSGRDPGDEPRPSANEIRFLPGGAGEHIIIDPSVDVTESVADELAAATAGSPGGPPEVARFDVVAVGQGGNDGGDGGEVAPVPLPQHPPDADRVRVLAHLGRAIIGPDAAPPIEPSRRGRGSRRRHEASRCGVLVGGAGPRRLGPAASQSPPPRRPVAAAPREAGADLFPPTTPRAPAHLIGDVSTASLGRGRGADRGKSTARQGNSRATAAVATPEAADRVLRRRSHAMSLKQGAELPCAAADYIPLGREGEVPVDDPEVARAASQAETSRPSLNGDSLGLDGGNDDDDSGGDDGGVRVPSLLPTGVEHGRANDGGYGTPPGTAFSVAHDRPMPGPAHPRPGETGELVPPPPAPANRADAPPTPDVAPVSDAVLRSAPSPVAGVVRGSPSSLSGALAPERRVSRLGSIKADPGAAPTDLEGLTTPKRTSRQSVIFADAAIPEDEATEAPSSGTDRPLLETNASSGPRPEKRNSSSGLLGPRVSDRPIEAGLATRRPLQRSSTLFAVSGAEPSHGKRAPFLARQRSQVAFNRHVKAPAAGQESSLIATHRSFARSLTVSMHQDAAGVKGTGGGRVTTMEPSDLGEGASGALGRAVLILPNTLWTDTVGPEVAPVVPFDLIGAEALARPARAPSTAVVDAGGFALVARLLDVVKIFRRPGLRVHHLSDLVSALGRPVAGRTRVDGLRIEQLLGASGLLEPFDPRLRLSMCMAMGVRRFAADEVIHQQGKPPPHFCLILQGRVALHAWPEPEVEAEVNRNVPKRSRANSFDSAAVDFGRRSLGGGLDATSAVHGPLELVEQEGGGFDWASLALVGAGGVRCARTAVALEPCIIATLPVPLYHGFLQRIVAEERLSQAGYLRAIPGLLGWDPLRLADLTRLFSLRRFRRGVKVMAVAADGSPLLMIVKRGDIALQCPVWGRGGGPAQGAELSEPGVSAPLGGGAGPPLSAAELAETNALVSALRGNVDGGVSPLGASRPLANGGSKLGLGDATFVGVGLLGPGQFLGHAAAFLGARLPLTAVAHSDADVHVADAAAFVDAVSSDWEAIRAMRSGALDQLRSVARRRAAAIDVVSELRDRADGERRGRMLSLRGGVLRGEHKAPTTVPAAPPSLRSTARPSSRSRGRGRGSSPSLSPQARRGSRTLAAPADWGAGPAPAASTGSASLSGGGPGLAWPKLGLARAVGALAAPSASPARASAPARTKAGSGAGGGRVGRGGLLGDLVEDLEFASGSLPTRG